MKRTAWLLTSLTFVTAWLVYQAALPLILRAWQITGDEPHYLLAAHSLAFDHDLDLANNYANRDYAAFYAAPYLDPHVRVQPDGAQLLSHDIGLPVLMAAPYAWGGRAGVMQFFAILGALLAAQMALLGYEAAGRAWAGALAGLTLALTAPLGLYTFQIYPELAGGLVLIWALRHSLNTPGWLAPAALAPGRVIALALALAALPWLSGRYAPLAGLLLALTVWQNRGRWKLLLVLLVPLAAWAGYLALNFALYGGPTPSATPAGNAVLAGFADVDAQQLGRGVLGWWLDQHRGLLICGPPLALAVIGLPHLWRRRGWAGLALYAPAAALTALAAAWGGFYSGWEVAAKFIIVGLPPLAAGLAAAGAGVAGRRRLLFWPLAAGLITAGAGQAAIMALDQFVMLHGSPVVIWETATGLSLRAYVPAAGTRYIEYPPAGGEWRAARGDARYLLQSGAISELSIGWYRLYAQAQITEAADPRAAALTVDAFSSEAGLPLLHADFAASDADPATGLVAVSVPFFNPYVDRWSFPFYVDVRATGAAAVRVSRLLFEPDPGPTYGLAALWLAGLGALTWLCAPGNKKAGAAREAAPAG